MLAEPTYLMVSVGLVVAVLATIGIVVSLPSRRRARQEQKRLARKAAAQRRQHRAELRMAPIRWEQERRRAEQAEFGQLFGEQADPELTRLLEPAEGQAGSEPLR